MSTYAWLITKDDIAESDADSSVGVTGPQGATDYQIKALMDGEGRTFYLYDDDKELYYTGRAINDGTSDGEYGMDFGPLDDFGLPNAGCTLIKWEGDKDFL